MRPLAVLLLSAVAIAPVRAEAQSPLDDVQKERLQVEEYRSLCVSIEEIIAKNNRTNFTTDAMRNRVEVRLRSAGIRPVDFISNMGVCANPRMTQGRLLQISAHFQGNAFVVKVDFIRHAIWWVSKSPEDIRGGYAPIRQEMAIGTTTGMLPLWWKLSTRCWTNF